jgi:hypothetical protein
MKSSDYIQVLSLTDPQAAFQGIAASFSALDIDSGGNGGITTAIPAPVWLAQNGVLDGQSDFLIKVKDVFNAKFANLPKMSSMRDEFIGNILSFLFGEFVEWLLQSKIFGEIAEYCAGILWDTITFIRSFLANYAKLCDAMKKENDALKTIPATWANYQIRNDVMQQHYEHVQGMMEFVQTCETHVNELQQQLPKAWVKWAKDMKSMPKTINEWMDDAFDQAEKNHDNDPTNDLPVPNPPSLPDIPQNDNVATLAFAHLIRNQTAVMLKFMQKHAENHEDLTTSIDDLQFNDTELALPGGGRVHMTGKWVEKP